MNEYLMNLQLFADGGESAPTEATGPGDAPHEVETGAQAGDNGGAESAPEPAERQYTQAEVDRMIARRMAEYQRDEHSRIESARAEAVSEAQRLANMTEAERREHQRQQAEQAAQEREAAIAKREAEITRRELRAEAVETLQKRGLPKELAEVLNYNSAEACQDSIKAVEKVFRDLVQAGVDARLRGSAVTVRKSSAPEAEPEPDDVRLARRLAQQTSAQNQQAEQIIRKFM